MLSGRQMLSALLAAGAALAAAPDTAGAADSEGGRGLPTRAPLATIGGHGTSQNLTRLNPLTLEPKGPHLNFGEYHNAYSFSPDGSSVAFSISSSTPAVRGFRIGVRVVDVTDMRVTADLRTGAFASELAWLEPRRLVARLPGAHVPVDVVDPVTGEELASHELSITGDAEACTAAEAPGQALLVVSDQQLHIVRADGSLEIVPLPPPFEECGDVAAEPGGRRAFALAPDGSVVAAIDLASGELEVHRFTDRGSADSVQALALDRNRVVLMRRGPSVRRRSVELLDLARGRGKVIDPDADQARIVVGRILTFRNRLFAGSQGIGVRGYDREGRRRFEVLGDERILAVEPSGRFAYALARGGFAVIDARSGAVVHRSSSRAPRQTDFIVRREGG